MARRTTKKVAPPEAENLDHPRRAVTCLGQAAAEARFLDAYNAGRLHHAWLLHGKQGVGKATFAYRAARFLLADEKAEAGGLFGAATAPTGLDRPPDDPGCRRVVAGSHTDLFTIEPERAGRQISVDSARGLIHSFQLTAGEGVWRVAIIDAADDLNRSAANILLKLIEEPPARTILFLIAHNPGRLPPTIRSRCARLPFAMLTDDVVARILADRRPDATPDALADAVRLAGGSAGLGLSLLDGGGAAVVDGLAVVLAARRGEGTLAAETFSSAVARDPFHNAIAGETVLAWLASAARPAGSAAADGLTPELAAQAAAAAALGPKPWLDLYTHAALRLDRARAVNLDPTQTLVDILARAQALLTRVQA